MPENSFKLHPIQLVNVGVTELWIFPKALGSTEEIMLEDSISFGMITGRTKFNEESKTIKVKVKVVIGEDSQFDNKAEAEAEAEAEDTPFDLRVEVAGVFSVDVDSFPVEFINDWAARNAPLILYPYVREQVYSLATRCGFTNVILPLFEVPKLQVKND